MVLGNAAKEAMPKAAVLALVLIALAERPPATEDRLWVDEEADHKQPGLLVVEFPAGEDYMGVKLTNSWYGPMISWVSPNGYAARHNVTRGLHVVSVAGYVPHEYSEKSIITVWSEYSQRGIPYEVEFATTQSVTDKFWSYGYVPMLAQLIPCLLGYYALYAGIPMFFFRVLTGTALKPEAWELEEKDGWEPMTALEKPPRLLLGLAKWSLLAAAICDLVFKLMRCGAVLQTTFSTRLLLVVASTMSSSAYYLVLIFSVGTAEKSPLLEQGAQVPAGVRTAFHRCIRGLILFYVPFLVYWQWIDAWNLVETISKVRDNFSLSPGDVNGLLKVRYMMAQWLLISFLMRDVLHLVIIIHARVQRVRDIVGEAKYQYEQVLAEIVELSAEVLPGLRAVSLQCVAISTMLVVRTIVTLFRLFVFCEKDFTLSSHIWSAYSLLEAWIALVATSHISDACLALMEDLNLKRASCSIEDDAKIRLIETFVEKSNRGQGIGIVVCGVVLSRKLLMSVAVSLITASSLVIGAARAMAKMQNEFADAMFNINEEKNAIMDDQEGTIMHELKAMSQNITELDRLMLHSTKST